MESNFSQVEIDEENEKNIFLLGIFVLFAWMLVIILCASPQLFRDFIQRHFCCFCWKVDQKQTDSLREAQERVMLVNESFLSSTIADNPSKIIINQVMLDGAPRYSRINIPDPIPEESRCSSLQPTNRSLSIASSTNNQKNADKSRTYSVSFIDDVSLPSIDCHKIAFDT